mmetsp:Transcript_28588/g.48631  ORF Transcript_28588/g.48631 Transcript_28588/m.48631 type:complete len:200 (+) Transcript_28588:2245-2844(+)
MVLLGVALTLEHIQHPSGHMKSSDDVDGRDGDSSSGQSLGCGGGQVSTTHEAHSPDNHETRNCIGDAHQRRMQSRGHAPHQLIPDDGGQGKRGHAGEEHWGGRHAHPQRRPEHGGREQDALECVPEVVHWWGRRRRLFLGWRRRRWWHPEVQNLSFVGQHGTPADGLVQIDGVFSLRALVQHEFHQIVGEHHRGHGTEP